MADDGVVIWLRPERPARGPAPSYSRAQITEVAIRIADAEGLDGLSMRKVAAELGSGTMSLYRYVPSREDLIALMIDAVVGELTDEDLALTGDWRKDLTRLAHRTRETLKGHPWMVHAYNGFSMGPQAVRATEAWLGAVDGLGLNIDQMMSVINMVSSHVYGFVRNELQQDELRRRTGLTDEEIMSRNGPYIRALLDSGRYPLVERLIIEAEQPHMDPDTAFAYGLGRILDGVAGSLPPPPQNPHR